MSKNIPGKEIHDDEIDLLDLFKRLGRSLYKISAAIGRGTLISFVFLFRKRVPLLLSIIVGLVIAYLLKFVIPSNFNSDLVLRTNSVSNSVMIAYVNRLHTFCHEKNMDALSSAISLSPEQVKNIMDISAFWIIDKGRDGTPDFVDYDDNHDVYDTINVRMADRLDVRVKIKLPQDLNKVSDGLIGFIHSDTLFQKMNRIRLRHNEELLSRINYDILQLDSLQKVKYFEETRNMQPKNGGQIIFLQEHNTQLVYDDIYTLYSRKQALETEQDIYNDITTILSNFSIPIKRLNGGSYYAVRIVPALFGATILLLILFANKKKLKEIYNKY